MTLLNRIFAVVLLGCSATLALADDMATSDDTMKNKGMSEESMNQAMDGQDMKKDDMADDMGHGMKKDAMSDQGMEDMKKDTMSMDEEAMDKDTMK